MMFGSSYQWRIWGSALELAHNTQREYGASSCREILCLCRRTTVQGSLTVCSPVCFEHCHWGWDAGSRWPVGTGSGRHTEMQNRKQDGAHDLCDVAGLLHQPWNQMPLTSEIIKCPYCLIICPSSTLALIPQGFLSLQPPVFSQARQYIHASWPLRVNHCIRG